jgi:hypothetical protein
LGDFKIFRPKVKEIFKFEVFFCHWKLFKI